MPDRQRAPVGLTLNLSSNNPFRNRTGGTSPSPRNSPFLESPAKPTRPVSTNPFLDDSDMTFGPSNANNKNTAALPEDLFVSPLSSVLLITPHAPSLPYPHTCVTNPGKFRAAAQPCLAWSVTLQCLLDTTYSSMERFKQFCEMFADFPTLQNELSLLDRPASNGMPNAHQPPTCKR